MRPEQAPVLFVVGGAMTALSVVTLMLSHQSARLALFMLSANVFWGYRGGYSGGDPASRRAGSGGQRLRHNQWDRQYLRGVYSAADGDGDEIGGVGQFRLFGAGRLAGCHPACRGMLLLRMRRAAAISA